MSPRPFGRVRKSGRNRWQASYPHPYGARDAHGQTVRILAPHTFATKTAARNWLNQQKALIDSGKWKSPTQVERERAEAEAQRKRDQYTFGDYATQFLARRPLASSTRESYEGNMRKWIMPRWADVPLKQITTRDVREWLTSDDVPPVAKTKRNMFSLFTMILNAAVDDEELESTPIKRNMLGSRKDTARSRRHEPRALEAWEVQAIADELPTPAQGLMFRLIAATGMRLGEARALTANKIDFKAGTLRIDLTVVGDGKQRHFTTPKTQAGIRVRPIPTELLEELRGHLQTSMRGPEAFVFTSSRDDTIPIPTRTFGLNVKRAAERLNLPPTSPYDARHTFASMAAIIPGVSHKDVSNAMGHENSAITHRYIHTSDTRQRQIADGVGRMLSQGSETEGRGATVAPLHADVAG